MRIPRITATIALSIIFTFGMRASASAGTITSSALFAGGPSGQNVCVAINVGKAPISVTVKVIGLSLNDTETCTVQPNDVNSSCQAFLNDFAFCSVTTANTKNVRAVLMNRSTASPFTVFATAEVR